MDNTASWHQRSCKFLAAQTSVALNWPSGRPILCGSCKTSFFNPKIILIVFIKSQIKDNIFESKISFECIVINKDVS